MFRSPKPCRNRSSLLLAAALTAAPAFAQPEDHGANALLAIDQNRVSVVERIVSTWGAAIAKSNANVSIDDLRRSLLALRADRLLAASLAGTLEGVRGVVDLGTLSASSMNERSAGAQEKALGDAATDVVYTPVTPCRLVDTRGTFAAVYQGDGTVSHDPKPFLSNEIRTYTVHGGNGVCLAQLPNGLAPSAVQLQVFGMPTTSASGDVEILPQGASFGSTATMVYIGSIQFNTVSTAAKINTSNNQISVQVRGGGANLAIDVVGYFERPSNYGGTHTITGVHATDSGGEGNTASGDRSTVDGGLSNIASGAASTVGGGDLNNASGDVSTIAGGYSNTASGFKSVVGGGGANVASGLNYPTVSGGYLNTASGEYSTVAGGIGNVASGSYSMVAGGSSNAASGYLSFAAGHRAKATRQGTFMWADSRDFDFAPSVDNFFGVRATGGMGVTVGINPTTGAPSQFCNYLPGYSGWSCTSDRNAKENFVAVDAADILRRLVAMPISTWNFKGADPTIRSLGPTAQDFYAAFGLGNDDKVITTSNLASVGLAAIQGLHAMVQEQAAELAALRAELKAMRDEHVSVPVARNRAGN